MVTLEVGIDAQGAITGSAQATSALNAISSSASFMFQNVSGASTALGSFGTLLTRATPWLAAASTALSGLSVGMTLLSEKTKQATGDWRQFVDAMREARAVGEIGGRFPGAFGNATEMSVTAMERASLQIQTGIYAGTATTRSVEDYASALNRRPQDIMRMLERLHDEGRMSPTDGNVLPPGWPGSRGFPTGGEWHLTPGAQIAGYEYEVERRRQMEAAQNPVPGYRGPIRPDASSYSLREDLIGMPRPDPFGLGVGEAVGTGSVLMSPGEQNAIDGMIARRDEGDLQRLYQVGDQVGTAIGDVISAFTQDLEAGKAQLKQSLLNLGNDLIGQAAREATRAIIDSFSGK